MKALFKWDTKKKIWISSILARHEHFHKWKKYEIFILSFYTSIAYYYIIKIMKFFFFFKGFSGTSLKEMTGNVAKQKISKEKAQLMTLLITFLSYL